MNKKGDSGEETEYRLFGESMFLFISFTLASVRSIHTYIDSPSISMMTV